MFFVFSGYFLGLSYVQNSGDWYLNTLRKKARSLVIPYCVWNIIYAFTYVMFRVYGNHVAGRALNNGTCLISEKILSLSNLCCVFGGNLFDFPADTPFWYIRNLLFIILISPLFMVLLRRRRLAFWLMISFFCVFFCLSDLSPKWHFFFYDGLSIRSLCFCFAGAYFAFYPKDVKIGKTLTACVAVLWIVMIAIATYCQLDPECNCYVKFGTFRLQVILGCLTLWFVYDCIPALANWGKYYAVKNHFFIYASHYGIMGILFCNKTQQLVYRLIGQQTLLFYFSRILVTFSICICGIMLLKKYRQSLLMFLCGGRA